MLTFPLDAPSYSGAWFLFLPPDSADLNPIEMPFARLKALFRKAAGRTYDRFGRRSATSAICSPMKNAIISTMRRDREPIKRDPLQPRDHCLQAYRARTGHKACDSAIIQLSHENLSFLGDARIDRSAVMSGQANLYPGGLRDNGFGPGGINNVGV